MSRVVFALVILALCGTARARDVDVRAVAPFVDGTTRAVLHVDLVEARVGELLGRLVPDQNLAEPLSKSIVPWASALRQAGAKDLFLVSRPSDFPELPLVVVPLAEGADAKAIGKLLCGEGREKGPVAWPTCATIHNAVFAGTSAALDRVRKTDPAARPELAAAFEASGASAAQIIILLTSDDRRVLEEVMPALPQEWGGRPISLITQNLSWAAIALETEPRQSLRLVVQAKDGASADAFLGLGRHVVDWMVSSPEVKRWFPDIAKLPGELNATRTGDRLVVDLGLKQGGTLVGAMTSTLGESYNRRECVNNMKQLALAMHNYHSTYNTFPPAFTKDKAGRPLLSWRVALLPFLEQEALYREFHHDEPWDSPHNRVLIEKMPSVYRCPGQRRTPETLGKTSYLVPRGKATIFPGAEAIKIKDITDGTSNTILVVDAADDRAVVWTKPDDWDVDPEPDAKGIFGHHPKGTNFGMADGSIRFLKETLKPSLLKVLVTRNGGEILSNEDY